MPRIELMYQVTSMTLVQRLLTEFFYINFDSGQAVNRRIINVEPLYFQGAIAGTEFLTYAATKLYLCMELEISCGTGLNAAVPQVTLYNEANAINFYGRNIFPYADAVLQQDTFLANNYLMVNKYFSRLVIAVYTHITFNGYRITLQ